MNLLVFLGLLALTLSALSLIPRLGVYALTGAVLVLCLAVILIGADATPALALEGNQ